MIVIKFSLLLIFSSVVSSISKPTICPDGSACPYNQICCLVESSYNCCPSSSRCCEGGRYCCSRTLDNFLRENAFTDKLNEDYVESSTSIKLNEGNDSTFKLVVSIVDVIDTEEYRGDSINKTVNNGNFDESKDSKGSKGNVLKYLQN